jgi:hypothetical protein
MFENGFIPLITPTIIQIVNEETGFYYSRKKRNRLLYIQKEYRSRGTKRIYSWDPKKSTGKPH